MIGMGSAVRLSLCRLVVYGIGLWRAGWDARSSRVLAPHSRYAEVVAIAAETFKRTKVVEATDATAPIASIGPLASRQQYDKVRAYVQRGLDEGAWLVTGGLEHPAGVPKTGYFVAPTVLADVNNAMTVAQEEIFGPRSGVRRSLDHSKFESRRIRSVSTEPPCQVAVEDASNRP